MKKNLLTSVLLLISAFLFSQNYNAYVPGRTAFFKKKVYTNDYDVDGIRVDTSFNSGNFTVYKNYRHEFFQFSIGSCLNLHDTSWVGTSILQESNGTTAFLNKSNDTLWFIPSAGIGQDGFVFPFANGDTLHGTVTAINSQTIFSSADNVKTLQLQHRDQNGNIIADNFNGKYIQVSQNYGCILAYSWKDFPSDTNSYHLAGMNNPQEGIKLVTAADIFNWNVGDQFDWYRIIGSNPQPYATTDYYTRVITGKTVSANLDTIRYTFLENYAQRFVYTITAQHWQQTGSVTYILSYYDAWYELNRMPYEYLNGPDTINGYQDGNAFYPYNNTQYNGRLQKGYEEVGSYYYYDSATQCFQWADGPDMCDGVHTYFADGIGEVYSIGGSSGCYDNFYLVYFSKGSETWGTPNDWPVILSNQDLGSINKSPELWPNPVNDVLNVTPHVNNGTPIHYQIFSASGQLLNEQNILSSGDVFQVTVNELPAGFYIFKLETKNTNSVFRFIKE
jgi:hypothetical protein